MVRAAGEGLPAFLFFMATHGKGHFISGSLTWSHREFIWMGRHGLKNRPAPSKHVYLRTTNLVQLCHFPDEATETQGPRNQPLSETKCIKNRRLSPEYGNQPHTSLAVSTTLTFDPNSNDCLSYLFNASGIWGLGPSSILKFIIERQTHTHTIHTHGHNYKRKKKSS